MHLVFSWAMSPWKMHGTHHFLFFNFVRVLFNRLTLVVKPFCYFAAVTVLIVLFWLAFRLLFFVLFLLFYFLLYSPRINRYVILNLHFLFRFIFLFCLHLFCIVFKSLSITRKWSWFLLQLSVCFKCFAIFKLALFRILWLTYFDKVSSTVSLMVFPPWICWLWFAVHRPLYVAIKGGFLSTYSITSPDMCSITIHFISKIVVNSDF